MNSVFAGCWVYMPAASVETGGWAPVPDQARVSTCSVEATVSWRAVQALTPDATQMADWSPAEVHFHCLCSTAPSWAGAATSAG